MISKETFQQYLGKVSSFFHNLGKIAIIAIAVGAGYGVCEVVHYIDMQSKVKHMQATKTIQETSIAINERNELMVINRKDGSYEIYQDSVGKSIFLLYAAQNYTQKQITK